MIRLTRTSWAAVGAALALAGGVGFAFARRGGYFGGLRSAPALVVSTVPETTLADTLRRSQTVSELFERRGVNDVNWVALERAVHNFDPARVKAGLVFLFQQRHGEAAPYAVNARVSRDERLWLRRVSNGWAASLERIAWRSEPLVVEGTVPEDGTLYDALDASVGVDRLPDADQRRALAADLADVFDWEIDFSRDIQPGDRFRVYAERMISVEGELRYGRILAARINVAGRMHYAFRFDDGDAPQFWDEKGTNLRRPFLRTPIPFRQVRITSRFSRSRWQPILHYYRAHLGTDFAAPYGTLVRTVGAGTVTFVGRQGDYGNMVEIRHPNGYETRYGHLSSFAHGLRVGAHVEQGDYVGAVGASGLATGPHLHYEVRLHGVARNPRVLLGVGTGAPIPASRRAEFDGEKERLLEVLEPRPAAVARTD